MDIKGKITGIKYKVSTNETLKVIDIQDFNINESPAFCLLQDKNNSFAISKWVSPKRTRSYPYERVYNTLNSSKKITIIPIVKDEGAGGDRDFIQWDTVSLMSLLDVFVIFAYYEKAENNPRFENKITNQLFDNKREKAEKAQTREMLTTQPKESLATLTKAKITITNYLGGQYFFTVDEILIIKDIVYLIESKHSANSILPSVGDIKDGLLKMILYSNLCEVEVDGVKIKSKAVLNLTSMKIKGEISEKSFGSERAEFIFANNLKGDAQLLISELFKEAEENGFEVRIGGVK